MRANEAIPAHNPDMATLTQSEIVAMSPEERMGLIDMIWSSFEGAPESVPTPGWHCDLLDERLDEADRSPENSVPWEIAKAELAQKWLR